MFTPALPDLLHRNILRREVTHVEPDPDWITHRRASGQRHGIRRHLDHMLTRCHGGKLVAALRIGLGDERAIQNDGDTRRTGLGGFPPSVAVGTGIH